MFHKNVVFAYKLKKKKKLNGMTIHNVHATNIQDGITAPLMKFLTAIKITLCVSLKESKLSLRDNDEFTKFTAILNLPFIQLQITR